MTKNQKIFTDFLRGWYSKNWKQSRADFAKFLGISYSQLSNMLADNPKKGGSEETRIKICEKIGIDYRSLIQSGHSDIKKISKYPDSIIHSLLVRGSSQREEELLKGTIDDYRGIPLYESGRLAAGINGVDFDPYEEPSYNVIVNKFELKGCQNHRLLAFRVGGDSMNPTVTEGSIVVVDLDNKEYFDRKIYAVCFREDGDMFAAVKRVKKWDGGFVLISDNPDYPPDAVNIDWYDLCVGRIVWQWKNMMES